MQASCSSGSTSIAHNDKYRDRLPKAANIWLHITTILEAQAQLWIWYQLSELKDEWLDD